MSKPSDMMKPQVWRVVLYILAVFGAFGLPFLVVIPLANHLKALGVEPEIPGVSVMEEACRALIDRLALEPVNHTDKSED